MLAKITDRLSSVDLPLCATCRLRFLRYILLLQNLVQPLALHPVSFGALRSSSQCYFLRRRRPWPARGAKELLISSSRPRRHFHQKRVEASNEDTSIRSEWRRATKTLPSEVSHFLTLAWQRDQGQTLATWLPKHVTADPAVAPGFSREIELHRLPETRSADRQQLSITLLIR